MHTGGTVRGMTQPVYVPGPPSTAPPRQKPPGPIGRFLATRTGLVVAIVGGFAGLLGFLGLVNSATSPRIDSGPAPTANLTDCRFGEGGRFGSAVVTVVITNNSTETNGYVLDFQIFDNDSGALVGSAIRLAPDLEPGQPTHHESRIVLGKSTDAIRCQLSNVG